MKTMILFLATLISLAGCREDGADKQETPTSIIGTWQLIEFWYIYDESVPWVTVEDGYTYTFNSDGSYISTIAISSGGCSSGGKYSTLENKLILNYDACILDTGIETPAGTLIENYTLDRDYLVLVPTYLSCDEGCAYKFKRISKE